MHTYCRLMVYVMQLYLPNGLGRLNRFWYWSSTEEPVKVFVMKTEPEYALLFAGLGNCVCGGTVGQRAGFRCGGDHGPWTRKGGGLLQISK